MNTQNAMCINIQIDTPYVTKAEYARRTGLPMDTVNYYVKEGKLPVRDRESSNEKVFINLLALTLEAAQKQ